MKTREKYLAAAAALLVLAAALLCVYHFTRPAPEAGSKRVSVTVTHKDGTEKRFSYQTDAEYLDEALLAEGLIEGEEGPYGLYVTAVDGEEADYAADGGWWRLTKDGAEWMYGASETALADGDSYEWTYAAGS